jgi:integrase
MPDRLAGELDRHFQRSAFTADDDLVFAHPVLGTPLDALKLRKRMGDAMKAAGMGERWCRKNGITFHSFRHTFGTRMAAGAPMRALQEWMGHRDFKTTLVYADYAPDPTGAAAIAERAFAASTNLSTNLSATESKTEQQQPL